MVSPRWRPVNMWRPHFYTGVNFIVMTLLWEVNCTTVLLLLFTLVVLSPFALAEDQEKKMKWEEGYGLKTYIKSHFKKGVLFGFYLNLSCCCVKLIDLELLVWVYKRLFKWITICARNIFPFLQWLNAGGRVKQIFRTNQLEDCTAR